MSSSRPKLIYFDARARAEPIRLLLAYGEVDYEDERLTRPDFAARKDEMPFGKVPVLKIDGMVLHQSVVICRYLGKKFGIAGKNEKESLECEMLGDTINDIRQILRDYFWEPRQDIKQEKAETMRKQVHYFLKRLEEIVNTNGGFLVDNQMSWVDFLFAGQADNWSVMAEDNLFASYSKLKGLKQHILQLPTVKKYIDSRPEVVF